MILIPIHIPSFHLVFCHQSAIEANGFRFLKEGERVQFEITNTEKGLAASNVRDGEGKLFNRTYEESGAGASRDFGGRREGGGGGYNRERGDDRY